MLKTATAADWDGNGAAWNFFQAREDLEKAEREASEAAERLEAAQLLADQTKSLLLASLEKANGKVQTFEFEYRYTKAILVYLDGDLHILKKGYAFELPDPGITSPPAPTVTDLVDVDEAA